MADIDVIKALYTAIEKQIFQGEGIESGNMISLYPGTGFSFDDNLDESNMSDLYDQSAYLDKTLSADWIVSETPNKLSELVNQASDSLMLPIETDVDEDRIDKLYDRLDRYETRYLKGKVEYQNSQLDYQAGISRGVDPSELLRLRQKRDAAMKSWQTSGRKNMYERDLAKLNQLTSVYPEKPWQRIRDVLDNPFTDPTKGNFQPIYLFPKVREWKNRGWSKVHVSSEDFRSSLHSKVTTWSVGGGFSSGLWRFGASESGYESRDKMHSDLLSLNLEMELLRVEIQRPFYVGSTFSSTNWCYNPTILDNGDRQNLWSWGGICLMLLNLMVEHH
ncbi:hypothetical protein QNZ76_000757 [Vibrio parahaemolyticus]|nr:hypothetical protein [Vibrio parahaemolyticus]